MLRRILLISSEVGDTDAPMQLQADAPGGDLAAQPTAAAQQGDSGRDSQTSASSSSTRPSQIAL